MPRRPCPNPQPLPAGKYGYPLCSHVTIGDISADDLDALVRPTPRHGQPVARQSTSRRRLSLARY